MSVFLFVLFVVAFHLNYCTGRPEVYNCSINIRTYSGYDGCDHYRTLPAYVDLNGRRVWSAGWWCLPYPLHRGVNIITVDPTYCVVQGVRNFDTWVSNDAAPSLVEYLRLLRSGALIVGVTGDEPRQHLNAALNILQAYDIFVADVKVRGSFAFVIQIGYPEKTIYVKSINNNLHNIELRVKVTGHTIENLHVARLP